MEHANERSAVKSPIKPAAPGRAGVEGSGPTSPNQRHQASQYSGHVRRLAASHNYVAH
jgi:hypothetical protein